MLKILRKKIQSLSQTQQNLIILILILFNIGIIIFWINFWLELKKVPPKIERTSLPKEAPSQEFLQKQFTPPSETTEPSEEFMKKLFKPGK
jgi:hypothetical protein